MHNLNVWKIKTDEKRKEREGEGKGKSLGAGEKGERGRALSRAPCVTRLVTYPAILQAAELLEGGVPQGHLRV